jgi:tRNA U34 5-methylaminomethyl-2-thiouridine-forming methyltransferase MnmC
VEEDAKRGEYSGGIRYAGSVSGERVCCCAVRLQQECMHAWKQVRSQPSSLVQAVPLSASFSAVRKPPASAKRASARAVVSRLAGRAVKLESMTRSEEKKQENRLLTT